jgi:demethylmenaquinone methyltransferase/2-methoxy-6-polyprenyl-1,4-benzoquinol methylase
LDDLLAEQIRYYRERAPEYDATSRPDGDPFASIIEEATAALRRFGPVRRAIELGAGTGQFTAVLAEVAEHVIALDASPEALQILATKVPTRVARVVGNVFTWRPDERAQLVVMAFLLSHIPATRFEAFWGGVAEMLSPGGRVFLIDESAHGLWPEEVAVDGDGETVIRRLSDGRQFRIVKVLWEPSALGDRLRSLGWEANLTQRDPFYWGTVAQVGRRMLTVGTPSGLLDD